MFMRFVQMTINPDRLLEFIQVYEDVVMPALGKTEGCLYAGLAHNVNNQEDGISITLWDSPENAERYEKGSEYRRLVDACRPFFAESSEWQMQLSENLRLEYAPVSADPVVKKFNNSPSIDPSRFVRGSLPTLFLRIVSLKVQPSKMQEFRAIYDGEIVPALLRTKGCRQCFVTDSMREEGEALSVTIWESLEDAKRYEADGAFQRLLEKLRHTLSGLYQWKMGVEDGSNVPLGGAIAPRKSVTSEDLSIKAYNIVSAKAFG